MPRSPQWMDLYQIWFRVSSRGHNQLCGILLQLAHGFRFCEGSKFAISHWLGRSPLTQCWRYRATCDNCLCSISATVRLNDVYASEVTKSQTSQLATDAVDYKAPFIATQLNSTSSWVELCRYKRGLTYTSVRRLWPSRCRPNNNSYRQQTLQSVVQ